MVLRCGHESASGGLGGRSPPSMISLSKANRVEMWPWENVETLIVCPDCSSPTPSLFLACLHTYSRTSIHYIHVCLLSVLLSCSLTDLRPCSSVANYVLICLLASLLACFLACVLTSFVACSPACFSAGCLFACFLSCFIAYLWLDLFTC